MSIKIAIKKSETTTDKGNLFEKFSEEFLKTQNYDVVKRMRVTGVELDLLCTHKNNRKEIYVECKAHEDNIHADTITKLLGTKDVHHYDEAWLVITSPLSKDAKGLVEKLKNDGRKDLCFYTEDKLITACVDANIIQESNLSTKIVTDLVKDDFNNKIGEPTLIISDRGYYWGIEYKDSGVATGAFFTDAQSSSLVRDEKILDYLTETEVFPKNINCKKIFEFPGEGNVVNQICPKVINLTEAYIKKTNEIGIRIIHPDKDTLIVDDIFVYPTLELIDSENREKVQSETLIELDNPFKKCLIFGEDLSGKTTLAQKLQKNINEKGIISLYLNAAEIKRADFNKFKNLLKSTFKKQYSDDKHLIACFDEILQKENPKISLIIDNYESLGIKRTLAKTDFQQSLIKNFKNIIIFANKSLEIEVMADSTTREQFIKFMPMRIKQFGHVLRDQFIENWLTVENGDIIPDAEIHNRKTEISEKIRVVVGTNFIPTYPLYLLTILQLIETASETKLQGSSYAELYGYLINQALGSANAKPDDLDFYHTYLSYLAYYMYKASRKNLPSEEIINMYEKYCRKMDIDKKFDYLHVLLNKAQILKLDNDEYSFSHNYSYYFFVAKYLSDNIGESEIKEETNKIIKHLYRAEYANILIFLIHHSKNKSIIDKIIRESSVPFNAIEPYLITDTKSEEFSKLIHKKLSFSIKDEEPSEHRKKMLAKKDEEEEKSEKNGDKEKEYASKEDLDLFGEINLSLKIIEIMGQITHNYYGSLNGKKKAYILNEAHLLGFRALNALLEDFEKFAETLRNEIAEVIEKKKPTSEADKEQIADKIIYTFTEMIVYIFLKRISDSITSKNLFPTLDRISDNDTSPGFQLVNLAVKLNFPNGLDSKKILGLDKLLKNNQLARRILRILVIEYLYKFDMKISEKQSICAKLSINLVQKQDRLGLKI